jgi:hypothetical protein
MMQYNPSRGIARGDRNVGRSQLTKGWIEVNDTSLAEHARLVERYGPEQADRMIKLLLKNYTRVALINTGQYEQQRYREVARLMAKRFGLRYEEIPGSTALVKKMICGSWDGDFVIARPGDTISYADFVTPAAPTFNLPGLPVADAESG